MRSRFRTVVFVCVFCVFALSLGWLSSTYAENDRQNRHRVPAEHMSFRGAQWLERDGRVAEERPEAVLDAMALEPGDVVADIGCGSGFYARRMARRVQPGGTVYCEDIQPEMLEIMQQLADAEEVSGIESVLGTFTDPMLPEGEIDWLIIADVYHEMSDPEPMLAKIRESLSPKGRVALLEYRVEDGTGDQIKADHTMSVRQVLREWKAAGFELVELHNFLPGQHLFFFRSAGSEFGGEVLHDHDLFEAIENGLVETEAVGAGKDAVTVQIRRTVDIPIVITSPVASHFRSGGNTRDMIARRDGWIRLADDCWHDWSIRAVGRQWDRDAPNSDDELELLLPTTAPKLEELMYRIQVGTYTVADSPTLYPPRTHAVEEAAIWIVESNPSYDELASKLKDQRIPPQYTVAFALVFLDLVGIDVTDRRLWSDRERVFGVLRDQGLSVWYQIKTTETFSR